MAIRLSFTSKLFLSYLLLILFSIFIGAYGIINLNTLKKASHTLIESGLPVLDLSDRMIDCLVEQNYSAKKNFILNTQASREHFFSKVDVFRRGIAELQNRGFLEESKALNEYYDAYIKKFVQVSSAETVSKTDQVQNQKDLNAKADSIFGKLRLLKFRLINGEREKLIFINDLNQRSFYTLLLLCTGSLIVGLGFAFFNTSYFASSIEKIKETTRLIGKGKFDEIPELQAQDEIGDLTEHFKMMGARLKELETMSLDANPLSRLPGNLVIERNLLSRIKNQAQFAFCLIDLDNFKPFGDTYGYSKGSEILTVVAGILKQTVQTMGRKEDFIGHIGGDDFVMITEPGRVHTLCQNIISEFDRTIPLYYEESDKLKGFIIAKDRNDVEQKFPIMTVSIAVVTNEKRKITDPNKVSEMAAQLKSYEKTFPKSIYVIDQRRT